MSVTISDLSPGRAVLMDWAESEHVTLQCLHWPINTINANRNGPIIDIICIIDTIDFADIDGDIADQLQTLRSDSSHGSHIKQ